MKKLKLPKMPTTSQLFWGIFSGALLAFAVWLVSPFFRIEPADYLRAGKLALRLAGGLFIFMIYAGKWSFDIFAPQGLAKRVSGLKSVALIVFDLLLVCFMIFIVAQAANLFLQQGIAQDEQNLNTLTTRYDPGSTLLAYPAAPSLIRESVSSFLSPSARSNLLAFTGTSTAAS